MSLPVLLPPRWMSVVPTFVFVSGLLVSGALSPATAGSGVSPRALDLGQVGCAGGATTITPCGTSADTLSASATGTRTFTIHNSSATDHTYRPSCAVTSPLASCAITPSMLVVPAGGSVAVAVSYAASNATAAGQGRVAVAIDGGAPDQVATVIAVGTLASTTTSK